MNTYSIFTFDALSATPFLSHLVRRSITALGSYANSFVSTTSPAFSLSLAVGSFISIAFVEEDPDSYSNIASKTSSFHPISSGSFCRYFVKEITRSKNRREKRSLNCGSTSSPKKGVSLELLHLCQFLTILNALPVFLNAYANDHLKVEFATKPMMWRSFKNSRLTSGVGA